MASVRMVRRVDGMTKPLLLTLVSSFLLLTACPSEPEADQTSTPEPGAQPTAENTPTGVAPV